MALFVSLGGTTYAATGGNFILGANNSADAQSSLGSPVTSQTLKVANSQSGRAIAGFSHSGQAIYGQSVSQAGLVGQSSGFDGIFGVTLASHAAGVSGHGNNGGWGLWGAGGDRTKNTDAIFGVSGASNGVHGESSEPTSSGVYGHNSASGYGVAGRSETGIGVLGDTTSGDGVRGITRTANHNGVYGRNTTGNCCAGYFDGPVQVNGNLKVNGTITSSQGGAWLATNNHAVGIIDDGRSYELTHFDLPAGNYAVNARSDLYDADNDLAVRCFLTGSTGLLDQADPRDLNSGGNPTDIPIALESTISLPTGGGVWLGCSTNTPGVTAFGSKIMAVSVGNLH